MQNSLFDTFFYKKYDRIRYNCMHFTVDVWDKLFGIDISFLQQCIVPKENGFHKVTSASMLKQFKKVNEPVLTPSLCLCRALGPDDLHVGTYIERNIFHITDDGVHYLPEEIVRIGFKEILYYEYNNNNQ